ncbi:disease resistance protein RPV1-like [Vitis riparia]|uniref:disease resistance protein RPV1-like n=1 Tax=Vitis riparia TaxID=96939 RepID=UPI00155A5982|nr:disease resistance protein RPV1-like [Vitis riparia]
MGHLRELNLRESGIKELPDSIGYLEYYLEILDLTYCLKFEKFPEIRGNMKCLKKLSLRETAIKELPDSIGSLTSLEILSVTECLKFEKFSDIFTNMRLLRELDLSQSGIMELPDSIGYLESLISLDLSECSNFQKFPEIQGNMKCLKRLSLEKTAIKEFPNSIRRFEALETLLLGGCSNFEKLLEIQKSSIGHLTQFHRLNSENCRNLRSPSNSICGLKSLKHLSLNGCSNVETFWEITEEMEHLECLYLSEMAITELPSSIEHLRRLWKLELYKCEKLVSLPSNIGNLTRLESLSVRNCSKLHNLPDNLRSLQCCLRSLDLGGCNMMEGEIPGDLWCLSLLLTLDQCNIIIPGSSGIPEWTASDFPSLPEESSDEEDEVHEVDEHINLTKELEDVHLGEKGSPHTVDNSVLGLDEGVEVRMPSDEFERSSGNEESTFMLSKVSLGTVEEQGAFGGIHEGQSPQLTDGSPQVSIDGSGRRDEDAGKAIQDLVIQPVNGPHTSVHLMF